MNTFWRGYRNKPPAIAEGRGLALCYGRHIHGAAISTTANVASAEPKRVCRAPIMIRRQGVAEVASAVRLSPLAALSIIE
jgi:hypothetical protein